MFRSLTPNLRILGSANAKNAFWIIGGKTTQMLISMVVSLLSARYLGPENYGTINYANSYIAFFTALCTLGINSIIVKEFLEKPGEQGETIGTTLVLRGLSSIMSVVMIFTTVNIVDREEPVTIIIVLLCSLRLIFEVFDTFDYWFQSRLQSRAPAVAKTVATIAVSGYKVFLLITGKNVYWFAVSTSIDYVVFAAILLIMYRKLQEQSLTFSIKKASSLLTRSYHFILSGVVISVYGYIDRLMIKQFLTSQDVGYYAAATSISALWVFVLAAVIDSMRPTIMQLYGDNRQLFTRRITQLYSLIIYASMTVALIFTFLAKPIVGLLYGAEYLPATISLRIVTWSIAFSYLGVARDIWIVCEGKQNYLLRIYTISAIINIVLNLLLIKQFGIIGAALTAVFTQICTSIIVPSFFKELRGNTKLIVAAFSLRFLRE